MTVVSHDGGGVVEKVSFEKLKNLSGPLQQEFLTSLFIMRASTPDVAKPVWPFGSMFGKMTDVNIWNYSMTME